MIQFSTGLVDKLPDKWSFVTLIIDTVFRIFLNLPIFRNVYCDRIWTLILKYGDFPILFKYLPINDTLARSLQIS